MEGLKKKKLIEEVVFYEPRAFSVEEKIRYTARNAYGLGYALVITCLRATF